MTLTHPTLLEFVSWTDVFKDTNSMAQFNQKLKKAIAQRQRDFPDTFDPLKMTGDGGELFTNGMFVLTATNKRFGLKDYSPNLEQDNGIDGFGTMYNGKPAVVQVKWYQDPTLNLTATKANLSSFDGAGQRWLRKAGFPILDGEKPRRMIVVTCARGLHWYTDREKFEGEMRCIGIKALREEFDGNLHFWRGMTNLVEEAYGA